MTGSSNKIFSYIPHSGRDKVRVADGSLSLVSGKGSICCTLFLSLSLVLHVPKISHNLLLISTITRDLNCSHFSFLHIVFSGSWIWGKWLVMVEYEMIHTFGRWFCSADWFKSQDTGHALQTDTTVGASHQLIQWHWRLGHPSFVVLGKLFLVLSS